MRGLRRLLSISTVSLLALWLSTGVGHAQGGGGNADYSRSGPYISISGLFVSDLYEDELEDQLSDAFGPVNVDVDNSGGISARVGMRLIPILAIELQYDWVAEYEVKFDVPVLTTDRISVDVKQQTLTANARINIPLGRVQPFVLAGIGFQHFELDGNATLGAIRLRENVKEMTLAGRLGVGVEFFVTENIGIIAEGTFVLTNEEFEVADQTINNLFYAGAGLGLTYRF